MVLHGRWAEPLCGGLELLNRETGTFSHYRKDNRDPLSLSSDFISSIYQDRGGVLWVGTSQGGVNKVYPAGQKFFHYKNNPKDTNSLNENLVTSFYENPTDELWMATATCRISSKPGN